jgi:hypothetical protein
MKKIFTFSLVMAVVTAITGYAQSNLLRNEGFETDTLGQLDFWQTDSFRNTDDARRVFTVEKPAHGGKRALTIVNLVPNDTRVVQWLAVEPDSYYRITCWVMAEKVSQGAIGANISISGSTTPSIDVKDTHDAWKKLELVGKTGVRQTALAVTLRLGFYDNLVTGRAYFDDAVAEKIMTPPTGAKVVDFYSNRGIGLIENRKVPTESVWDGTGNLNVLLALAAGAVILVSALISLILSALKRRRLKTAAQPPPGEKDAPGIMETMTRAQRKSLRINVSVKKTLSGDNYRLIELRSVNLSDTGLLLSSDDLGLFAVGERLELAATYKKKKYDLGAARVVRKQATHQGKGPAIRTGFGLVFIDPTTAQAENIKTLLR